MNFGSFQTTKKRVRQTTLGGPSTDRRKACPQGTACPFQHEYQHNLEFSHSSQPQIAKGSQKDGNKSIAINRENSTSAIFSNKGNKLGGSLDNARTRFPSQFESHRPIANTKRMDSAMSSNLVDLTSPDRTLAKNATNHVYCDTCGCDISIYDFEEHLRWHENGIIPVENSSCSSSSSSSSDERLSKFRRSYNGERLLKGKQDDEYDESVVKEIERQSAMEHDQQLLKQKEMKMLEEVALIESQREAFRLKQLEEHQIAKLRSPPEPSDICGEDLVSLRFTLPSGKKVTRRFRKDGCIQEVFMFLKTLEDLIHLKYELKTVIGNVIFHEKMQNTLREVGLTSNTSLVLVVVDITDAMINEILNDGTASPLTTDRHRKVQKREESSFKDLRATFDSMSLPRSSELNLPNTAANNQRKRGRQPVIDLT